jgi:hypothetical protein
MAAADGAAVCARQTLMLPSTALVTHKTLLTSDAWPWLWAGAEAKVRVDDADDTIEDED